MITIFAMFLAGVMLVFSQGCVCKQKYNAMVDERDDCMTENKLLEMQIDTVEAQNEFLATKLVIRKTGTAVIHSLYEELVDELEAELASSSITIKEMKSGVTVHLPHDVLFASGSAELNKSGREIIMKVGSEIAEVPYQTLVAGFTDNVPVGGKLAETYPTNWELAGARAASVVRVLEEAGVAKEQLRAVSFSENMPVASNDTPEGRAKNRRIEIRMRPVVAAE